MSKIIKSFRVVEEENIFVEDELKNEEENVFLEEAKKKYDEIVSKALKEADRIVEEANEKSDIYLNQAYEKSKEIFNEWKEKGYTEGYDIGYKEGYSSGYESGEKVSNKLIEEALEIKNNYINKKENIYREIEEDVIELVINICEKIIYDKVEEDSEYIVTLILKGIESLNSTDNLMIRVSKEDYDIVEMSKDKILAKASLVNDLEIRLDSSLNKGDCIIETASGSVDVSIKDQVEEVKQLLNDILNSE
ncbi:MAG: FliH domain-containing protein [Sporanaerobacter sp.]|uniref:FliH/SctL family protein n=1 Tax=Sporanaerobacter sp. TaxID=2010183 RepID=UPI003A100134